MIWDLIQNDIFAWTCGHKLAGDEEMTKLVWFNSLSSRGTRYVNSDYLLYSARRSRERWKNLKNFEIWNFEKLRLFHNLWDGIESAAFPCPWPLVFICHFMQIREVAEGGLRSPLLDHGPCRQHAVMDTWQRQAIQYITGHPMLTSPEQSINQFPYTFRGAERPDTAFTFLYKILLCGVCWRLGRAMEKGVRGPICLCRCQTQLEFLPLFSYPHHWTKT